jgi:hypothetical protein
MEIAEKFQRTFCISPELFGPPLRDSPVSIINCSTAVFAQARIISTELWGWFLAADIPGHLPESPTSAHDLLLRLCTLRYRLLKNLPHTYPTVLKSALHDLSSSCSHSLQLFQREPFRNHLARGKEGCATYQNYVKLKLSFLTYTGESFPASLTSKISEHFSEQVTCTLGSFHVDEENQTVTLFLGTASGRRTKVVTYQDVVWTNSCVVQWPPLIAGNDYFQTSNTTTQ